MAVTMAKVAPNERPRERLFERGAQALSDRELLALLLRSGTRAVGALDLAAELLAEYGSLAALAEARPEELAGTAGIGAAKAASLVAAFQVGRRVDAALGPITLRDPKDVARVARNQLGGLRRERVLVLVCDSGNRLRRCVAVTDGSIERALFPVREVLNAVLRHDGRAFAVAHNHPGGSPEPTQADRRATADLSGAAPIVGLRFLGHVVVAEAGWRSVAI